MTLRIMHFIRGAAAAVLSVVIRGKTNKIWHDMLYYMKTVKGMAIMFTL